MAEKKSSGNQPRKPSTAGQGAEGKPSRAETPSGPDERHGLGNNPSARPEKRTKPKEAQPGPVASRERPKDQPKGPAPAREKAKGQQKANPALRPVSMAKPGAHLNEEHLNANNGNNAKEAGHARRGQQKPAIAKGHGTGSGANGPQVARPAKTAPKGRAPEAPLAPAKGVSPAPRAGRAEAEPPVTEIIIPEQITVRELAEKMRRSPIEVIKTLMNYGIMVPITQSIDFDTASVVGEEMGITVKREVPPEPEAKEEPPQEAPRTLRQRILATEKPDELVVRPPIVTVLGHVDHGKTTLLDAIRQTRVVEGEAGGITQHIGAYQVECKGRKITFLDTPGHEAFTAMRARGAMVTDIAVLVVAADDGVMPQTKEAIAHARAAQVPIVVALNKIDKPNANPERVKQELADNGLLIEEYGGDVICVPVSAKLRRGIDDLLESILLVADIEPLKANPKGKCVGTVIESRLDKSRGPTATLLVQNGTLRVGDSLVIGEIYGKVRAMYDDKGQPINEAPPSAPVVVLGLADVPRAGDTFSVEADERTARAIAAERQAQKRAESAAAVVPKALSLETIFAQAEAGQVKELNIILKADVQGSIEPIVSSLEKLGDEKLRVRILHQAPGNITESDVMLAAASKAIILGFSVDVDPAAQRAADAEGVDIRVYDVIYNLIEDVRKALSGLLEPVYQEVITGHAEVRAIFRISKVGKVAGCYVTDGAVTRNALVRVKRGDAVLQEDRIASLKRFQEDVTEVRAGFECGVSLANFSDFEVGDIFEVYQKERVS